MVFLDTPPDPSLAIMDDYPDIIEDDDIEEEIEDDFPIEDITVERADGGTGEIDFFGDEEDDDTGQGDDDDDFEEDVDIIPETDDAKYVFKNHHGSVFCCDIEPKEAKLVITGGQDDKAFVWNIDSGEILFECTDHEDSVSCVGFSHDGMYAATADMSGIIQVWKVSTKTLVWGSDGSYGDIQWIRWHHSAHVLFCGFAAGDVFVFKIPSGEMKVLPGSGERAESGIIMPDGKRCVVGYKSGAIKVFDIKSVKIIQHVKSGDAHRSSITALDAFHDDNLIMSGDLDGIVAFITTTTGKVISVFDTKELDNSGSANGEETDDDGPTEYCVEAVAFYKNPSFPVAVSVNCSGYLYIWDVRRQALRYFEKLEDCGITTVVWRSDSPVTYLASIDGSVRIYDTQNNQEIGQLSGHRRSVLDISLSADGKKVVTVSDDNEARVFDVQKLW